MLKASFLDTAMTTKLFLLFCLLGFAFGSELPDVECTVIHLKYVSCVWNPENSEASYTLISWFKYEKTRHVCTNVTTECVRPFRKLQRFEPFHTILVHGHHNLTKEHNLKSRVLLNPPTNLTVLFGEDKNLWFYWNQTDTTCVESEVRYRANKKNWRTYALGLGRQHYCINLPPHAFYELQVRSKVESSCGESIFWSDWSEPVQWGSNNSTDPHPVPASVWTPLLSVVGSLTVVILVVMSLHHERLRVIPVVPKPMLIFHEEDWLQFSKGLKESFKNTYTERACPVREYCHVSQSDCESSSSSTSSLTTDQTDCSVSCAVTDPTHSPASTKSCKNKELQESV